MRELLVVFRSRSEAVRFYEGLVSYGISAKIVNTPSSAKVGCGLSVKFFAKNLAQANVILDRGGFASVVGLYYFSQNGGVVKM